LLISAFKACKVGGSILYSTCTSNPLENEVNVQLLLDKYGDKLELQEIKIDWLSAGLEGLEKSANTVEDYDPIFITLEDSLCVWWKKLQPSKKPSIKSDTNKKENECSNLNSLPATAK
jgi:hypothetical protein